MKQKHISTVFRIKLLKTTIAIFSIALVIVIVALSVFIKNSATATLNKHNYVMKNQVKFESNLFMAEQADKCVEKIEEKGKSKENLNALKEVYYLNQLHFVNKKGIITHSTEKEYIGYNIFNNKNSARFSCLLNEKKYYYSYGFIPDFRTGKGSLMYSGCVYYDKGFVLMAYTPDSYSVLLFTQIMFITNFDIIGENGFGVIANPYREKHLETSLFLYPSSKKLNTFKSLGINDKELKKQKENILYQTTIKGTEHYYTFKKYKGNYIFSFIPTAEIVSRWTNILAIISGLVLILLIAMFIRVNRLNKKLIVKNIDKINNELNCITDGNLDTVIDVRDYIEFSTLSDDINATVKTLKGYIEKEAKRIDEELEFARNIQISALQNTFPPFPDRKDFDIYASMVAAKVVGGDFYDFFIIGKNKLGFLIADVSDKGVPAAMFMMKAKVLLKSLAQTGRAIDEVLNIANNTLCDGNNENMFVTLWLGVLNTDNGKLTYANAGHCFPIIKSGNDCFYLETKPNLSLGLMEDINFRKYETTIKPKSYIFLYTDGVTEAENSEEELFGNERLLESVKNISGDLNVYEFCNKIKDDLNRFTAGAAQTDDITMLSLFYSGTPGEITVDADIENIEIISEFLCNNLRYSKFPENKITQIEIVADEICGNIVHYAYPDNKGTITVSFKKENDKAIIKFIDNGVKFNPLSIDEADTSKETRENEIGGLGMHLVKKFIDDIKYEYIENRNELTITI